MPIPIQSQSKGEMRRSIGRNFGICIVGEATSTVDTSSLIDGVNLRGGDDEHNEKQVMIYDPTGSIVAGEKSFVADYAGATWDATCAPVFTASIADGDKFEMWDTPWFIGDIDDVINQAIRKVSASCLKEKQTVANLTVANTYEYAWLSGFKGLYLVEHVSGVGIRHLLDPCEDAWTAGSNATVTADSSFKKVGNASMKAVVVGAGANEILCYKAITSTDISDSDKVEFWFYSSIALTAGQLQIKLDDTAAIASALEAIDIPAMDAATWTKLSLSLANPHLDTAIISIGIYQVANVADFTLYVDEVDAVLDGSKKFRELNTDYWNIVRNSTNKLKFTPTGKGVVGDNTEIRLTGLQLPALLSDDTTNVDIDPQWIVDYCVAYLMLYHAKSPRLETEDRRSKSRDLMVLVERGKTGISSAIPANTVWF